LLDTYVPDIDTTDAKYTSTIPDLCNLLGGGLGLVNATADDAGVGAEMDEGPGLSAADGPRAARNEQDSVGCFWN
jgi:hypothetical protein